MALPYYPLTAAGVNNPTLVNADLLYLDGKSGYSGRSGYSGVPGSYAGKGDSGYSGKSGYSGVSGKNPLIESATFPGTVPTELLWNRTDEALYAAVSGYTDWIQVGAGTSGYSGLSGYSGAGESGYSGISGSIAERANFPAFTPAELMWNTTDQALYAGVVDGSSNWVQVGAGTSGYSGISGYSGYSGISGFSGTTSSLVDYSSSTEVVGFDPDEATSIKVWYRKNGTQVFVYFTLFGTGADEGEGITHMEFSVPYPADFFETEQYFPVYCINCNNDLDYPGLAILGSLTLGSGYKVECFPTWEQDVWTGTGTRLISGTLIYETSS